MSRQSLVVILILLMSLCLFSPSLHAKIPLSAASSGSPTSASQAPYIRLVAWEENGRVQVAVANTSSAYEELTVGFGYQRLGRRIVQQYFVDVAPKTILVDTYPVFTDDIDAGSRVCDTVYLFDYSDRQIATAPITGVHGATSHFTVDRYLVPAGEDAMVYLETPGPEEGIGTDILISVGKNYTIGDYTGRVIIDKIHRGAFDRANNPYIGEIDDANDYHNYAYSWRGLAIRMPTLQIKGVERLNFSAEKFISTADGVARHGLASPPILVYGADMRVLEF